MKLKRRYKFFHVIIPENSLDNRVSHLEGARSASQWLIGIFVAIIFGMLSFFGYQEIKDSIYENIKILVNSEVIEKSSDMISAASTAESALKDITSIATEIVGELEPTPTPSPSIKSASDMIYEYFDLLNNNQFIAAWTKLTWGYGYISGAQSYDSFENHWNRFEQIDLIEVVYKERTETTSQFSIKYETNRGRQDSDIVTEIYFLVYDENLGRWLINYSEGL